MKKSRTQSQYQCSRCGRAVAKLVPIDDAEQSAQDSAEWSALLKTPYPSTYTDYVCITCANEILGITEEDIIQDDRIRNRETEFNINLLKGRLSQTIIETIFQEFGYEVYTYGYESYLPNLVKSMRKGKANLPVKKLRATPDLIIYNRESNEGFLVEVKATNTPDETEYWFPEYKLQNYITFWPEAILVVYCIPSMNIYCCKVTDINVAQLKVRNDVIQGTKAYIINLKETFFPLPKYFSLIEPSRYQEFLQRIQSVLQDFHPEKD